MLSQRYVSSRIPHIAGSGRCDPAARCASRCMVGLSALRRSYFFFAWLATLCILAAISSGSPKNLSSTSSILSLNVKT